MDHDMQDMMYESIGSDDVVSLSLALSNGANPNHNEGAALVESVKEGASGCFSVLLWRTNHGLRHKNTPILRFCFLTACQLGRTAILEEIIPLVDVKENNSHGIRIAADNSHVSCVRALLQFSDIEQAMKFMGTAASSGKHLLLSVAQETRLRESHTGTDTRVCHAL